VRYNKAKITSKSGYQISVAGIKSDANVYRSQPPTTFQSFVTDEYSERSITKQNF